MAEEPTTPPIPAPRLREAVQAAIRESLDVGFLSPETINGLEDSIIAHVAPVLAAVERERDRYRKVLASVEWNGSVLWGYDGISPGCPACGGMEPGSIGVSYVKQVGHTKDCALAAALAGGGENES